MLTVPKLHMRDMRNTRRPIAAPVRDDLRPARAILGHALIGAAIAALVAWINWPAVAPDTPRTVSGGQMILALSGCPDHDGTAQVLVLQLTIDPQGIVRDAACARVERPTYMPKRRVRS